MQWEILVGYFLALDNKSKKLSVWELECAKNRSWRKISFHMFDLGMALCSIGVLRELLCFTLVLQCFRKNDALTGLCGERMKKDVFFQGEIRARTLYLPMQLCHYNNNFQQLFNKYAINDTMKHHSCLVHYANADVMRDIYEESGKEFMNSSVLNVLPGITLLCYSPAKVHMIENAHIRNRRNYSTEYHASRLDGLQVQVSCEKVHNHRMKQTASFCDHRAPAWFFVPRRFRWIVGRLLFPPFSSLLHMLRHECDLPLS